MTNSNTNNLHLNVVVLHVFMLGYIWAVCLTSHPQNFEHSSVELANWSINYGLPIGLCSWALIRVPALRKPLLILGALAFIYFKVGALVLAIFFYLVIFWLFAAVPYFFKNISGGQWDQKAQSIICLLAVVLMFFDLYPKWELKSKPRAQSASSFSKDFPDSIPSTATHPALAHNEVGTLKTNEETSVGSGTVQAQPPDNRVTSSIEEATSDKDADSSTKSTFSLGDSFAYVEKVQGAPTSIKGNTWNYGKSKIEFKDGRVAGYRNAGDVLHVNLTPASSHGTSCSSFKLGATKDQVLQAMGTPSEVRGERWLYGRSLISFQNETVDGYRNKGNLLITATATIPGACFSIGSSTQDVIDAMGVPTAVTGSVWEYKDSMITFRDNTVSSYQDKGNHLRLRASQESETSQSGASSFSIGSSEKTVLAAMGTPSGIVGSTWSYQYSSITFSDGLVSGYSDISHNLRIADPNDVKRTNDSLGFFIGSSREDVLNAMGAPSGVIGDQWSYQYSTVTFEAGQVNGYHNASQNLRLRAWVSNEKPSLCHSFSLGSTKQHVLNVMGTPTGILGDSFQYSYSSVSFAKQIVTGYHDASRNLKIANKYRAGTPRSKTFNIGSSKNAVLAAMSAPTGILGETWQYEYSSVNFADGSVCGYHDTSHNLSLSTSP